MRSRGILLFPSRKLRSSPEPNPNKKYLRSLINRFGFVALFLGVFVIYRKATVNHFSDEQLVGLYIKEKDEQALEDLIRRYLPLIYAFTRNYTGGFSLCGQKLI